MNKVLNADAWRSEIERAMRKAGDDGMTTREIREAINVDQTTMSMQRVSVILSNLFRQGRIKSGRRMEEGRDGITRPVPVYVILKEKRK